MNVASVHQAARLRGELRLPGDKSISHRALLLAALAEGEGWILGASDGADVRATARLVRALGVQLERRPRVDGDVDYRVRSPGVERLQADGAIIDCANSGTSMRLGAGALAGLVGDVTLDGDASLRRRPMDRVVIPLRALGADITVGPGGRPPLRVRGRRPLQAIDYTTPVPSAQVKSAILLAALRASGRTTVREALATRDHTERMLRARGVPVLRRDMDGQVSWTIEGGTSVGTAHETVPGDLSSAAFWLVAAVCHPHALITLRGVGINPTRAAVLGLLASMGADIEMSSVHVDDGIGEPTADIVARSSTLTAIDLTPIQVATAIDEIPILALAATQAQGTTRFRGAAELRYKESDRLAGIVAGLRALGAHVDLVGNDISISGPTPLLGAVLDPVGDHRLALTFAVAGLFAEGVTTITDADCVAVSYPTFFAALAKLSALSV